MTPGSTDGSAPDGAALAAANAAIGALPRRKDQLLPALQAAQAALGWLPRDAIELVHRHTRVPLSEVYATATAYSELRLEPPVPGRWHVCAGVACDLAGSAALLAALPERTAAIDCQFLCPLAPVAVDDHEQLYGRVTLDDLRARLDPSPAPPSRRRR